MSKDIVPTGLLTMTILTEGTTPQNKASKANLATWIARVPTYHSAALDSVAPQPFMEDYFNVPRDHFIIVNLETMVVEDVYDSDPQGALTRAQEILAGM